MAKNAGLAATANAPRSRRLWAVVAAAIVVVLLTLAGAFIIEGLNWFAPQGWALRVLAILGLVAWPRLTRMGRIGAVAFAVGVTALSVIDIVLQFAPEVGYSGALNGVTLPLFVVAAAGFFVLVFGAVRALRGPWWTTTAIAAVMIALWGVTLLVDFGAYSDVLGAMHIVSRNYLFAVALVSLIAAIIDVARTSTAKSRH
jgi:hypothetical protein